MLASIPCSSELSVVAEWVRVSALEDDEPRWFGEGKTLVVFKAQKENTYPRADECQIVTSTRGHARGRQVD